MNSTTQTISPLHQRLLDDMRMRKLSPKTQSGYWHIRQDECEIFFLQFVITIERAIHIMDGIVLPWMV